MAIALFFRRNVYSVRTAYTKQDIHGLGPSTSDFYERAIKICCDVGLIARHDDDFGPVSYTKTERSELADRELDERYPVFARYYQQADGAAWLAEAHRKITSEWMSVEFAKDDPQPDVWQPIPVERNNPSVERAEAALDKGIDIIRSDNGYNATHPEERRYVLDHLTAFAKRMKEDAQIGWMYFKTFAIEPLDTVIKRFGKAATGIASAAAREALIRWARESGGEIIRFLLGLLT